MTTASRQLILTLTAALAGGALMFATASTFNPAFCCVASKAYGWPFPWETIDSHHSGLGLRHPADYWVYNLTILLGASFFIGRCVRGRSVARPTLSVIAMLTIAPLIAVTLLLGCTPRNRNELLYPIAIATYALWGIRALWLTYIPALIIVPVLMRRVSTGRAFQQLSLVHLLRLAVLVGAIGGACVMIPRAVWLLVDAPGSYYIVLVALSACAVSGGITLALICFLYRYAGSRAEPVTSPNGGPAMPLGNAGLMEGPPSVR